MTREESLSVTAHIGSIIAEKAPRVLYTPEDVKQARGTYSDEKLSRLSKEGYYFGDFERFYITLRLCDGMDLWKRADEDYLKALFRNAKKMEAKAFSENPYLKQISIRETRLGDFLLTHADYRRGEFFQWDMPSLTDALVVPKIGFFTESVRFPALYEKNTPWVSVCPSETSSMAKDIPPARGRVLVLGLGLGYYPFMISEKEEVESITVVEKSREVISLFRSQILPQIPHREKFRLVEADAFDFLAHTENGEYDFCYADIWEGWMDGSDAYRTILPHEKRLSGCEFHYWIRDEILWYLENGKKP